MKKTPKLFARLRKAANLSQSEVAKRLGISRPTLILIEDNKKEVTFSQAKLLSELYNVSIDVIHTGKVETKDMLENDIVSTLLPTKQGTFYFSVWNQKKGEEIIFLQTPNLDISKSVLVRVHSECLTGDTFHSYRCDCEEQKDRSLSMIAESGNGVFIYLRQEGRGIGLHEKIKAYILQDKGYDTHEANILLGHKPDYREYSWVKKVLDHLQVKKIKLITNNPSKVSEIARLGITITDRIPLVIESNTYNRRYFETKRQKFKHFFGKDESNYFYQFTYVESPEQVTEIGNFMAGLNKDPLLKICLGIYADAHVLNDVYQLKKIEAICKATEYFEGFVPILHFTFKFSTDPLKDIAIVREKMPYVKYVRLNDLVGDHLKVLKYANKFFLVDIPLSDDEFHLIDNTDFVEEVLKHKTFLMIDNSRGSGKQDTKANIKKKIDVLLANGINDIALCGGFGPGLLSTYFEMKEHYKINLSIDAESKLKTGESIDMKKVKTYLSELINHK